MYFAGAVGMLIVTPIAFMLINTGNPWNFTIAVVLIFGITMSASAGVTGSLFAMIFTPEVRYTGASVGYTISQIAGPAFAPMIATGLLAATGSSGSVVVYLVIICLISVVSAALIPGGWGRKEAAHRNSADNPLEN
jgi:MFS family permease